MAATRCAALRGAARGAAAALAEVVAEEDVKAALRWCEGGTGGGGHAEAAEAAHRAVRSLCSRRRCTVTTPESPF